MAGTEALVFFVVVPVLAWAIELLLIRGSYESASRDLAARGQPVQAGRAYVLLAYGAFPVVLGLVLWFLSLPLTDRLDSATSFEASLARSLLVWAAVAYGIAALVTAAARALILRARFLGLMAADFGRILPIWVIPHTGTVYALVLGFLVLGAIDDFLFGTRVFTQASVDPAVAALQAYAVSTLGFLAGALASNRIRDLSAQGYQRALLFAVVGELPALLGLILGFLAIGKL